MLATTQWPLERAAHLTSLVWVCVLWLPESLMDISALCEACYICTHCEPLYPKRNRISSNKRMNMTPYSQIHPQQRHFVDCQRTRMTQITKDFAMRHDENDVEWNGISIKSHQFVTNCLYQTIYSKHNICSYEFLLRFHDSFAGRLRNPWAQSNPDNVVVENWHIIYFFINLHNTTDIIIIIKWNVLFVEKIFLMT